MRHSRLSEIDLARALTIAPDAALEAEMRSYNASFGSWSYGPTRASTSDLVCAIPPLLGPMPPVDWSKLSAQIQAACRRGSDQIASNIQVSKVLFDAARARGWRAVQVSMGSLSIGRGESVRYWSDIVLEIDGQLVIPFFDHRRSNGLSNADARRVVYSMQHIGIRERNPDLALARLAVVRFPVHGDERSVLIHLHDGRPLIPYREMDARVSLVYETWARVSDERNDRDRRAAGGGGGNPFGF